MLKSQPSDLIKAITGKIDVRNWQPPKSNTSEAA